MTDIDDLLPSAKDCMQKIARIEAEKASEHMRRTASVEAEKRRYWIDLRSLLAFRIKKE